MTADPTGEEIRRMLELEPNATRGSVRVTYKSALSILAGCRRRSRAGGDSAPRSTFW